MKTVIALLSWSFCWPVLANLEPVRNIDARGAPEVRVLAERARRIGDAVYPQVVDLLGGKKSDAPRRFDIVFATHLIDLSYAAGEEPLGLVRRRTVFLNAGFLCQHPEYLDPVLVHEMAHVAQNYPTIRYPGWRWLAYSLGFKAAHPLKSFPRFEPAYWTEGIADYVCARLGHTNVSNCPQCSERFSDYTKGYSCASAFLLYIDDACGPGTVQRINVALRSETNPDGFFTNATGRPLEQLWAEFQKTPSYKPIAAELNELHQALGYADGKPPRDIEVRLKKYLAQHPEIKDLYPRAVQWSSRPQEDAEWLIAFLLYVRQQPDGEQRLKTADAVISELHQALAYKKGEPPGGIQARFLRYLDAHADMKECVAAFGLLERTPLPDLEGFAEAMIFDRLRPGWKTNRAAEEFLVGLKRQSKQPGWRRSEHGTIRLMPGVPDQASDTYPVDRTFRCQKEGRKEFYIYTVVKDSPDSGWMLKRAWETTAKGRLLKDFTVQ